MQTSANRSSPARSVVIDAEWDQLVQVWLGGKGTLPWWGATFHEQTRMHVCPKRRRACSRGSIQLVISSYSATSTFLLFLRPVQHGVNQVAARASSTAWSQCVRQLHHT